MDGYSRMQANNDIVLKGIGSIIGNDLNEHEEIDEAINYLDNIDTKKQKKIVPIHEDDIFETKEFYERKDDNELSNYAISDTSINIARRNNNFNRSTDDFSPKRQLDTSIPEIKSFQGAMKQQFTQKPSSPEFKQNNSEQSHKSSPKIINSMKESPKIIEMDSPPRRNVLRFEDDISTQKLPEKMQEKHQINSRQMVSFQQQPKFNKGGKLYKITVIKQILYIQKKLSEYEDENIYGFDQNELLDYDIDDLQATERLLHQKLSEIQQSMFLENVMVTSCQIAESFLDGKRALFGYRPNLKGFHHILRTKLRGKRHLIAEKSKRIQEKLGEENLLVLDVVIGGVQYMNNNRINEQNQKGEENPQQDK